MVNGNPAKYIYYGVLVLLGIVPIGSFVLQALDKSQPGNLDTIVATLLAYLAGSHVRPPVGPKIPEEPTSKAVE
jgi:hypothetical protein